MNLVIVGAQWGDEGKGKIVDFLCDDYDLVVRYQGGNNAGHTVCIGDKKYALHLLPSGILHNKQCVLGNGMVIDVPGFLSEVQKLPEECNPRNIVISNRAHVVMIYHKLLDWAGSAGIGTTQRGIGPAYVSKADRTGAIRICDLGDEAYLTKVIPQEIERTLALLRVQMDDDKIRTKINQDWPAFYDEQELLSAPAILENCLQLNTEIMSYVGDGSFIISEAIASGKRILFEGAQGALLDIDHGTYPFVTSSSTSRGGVFSGSGYNGVGEDRFVGIVKAYTTRVGAGPFPTELRDATGEHLTTKGHEFGTTTGRRRRCGWLDVFALRYAHQVIGFDAFVITKLDVLSGLPEVQLCTGYLLNGKQLLNFPASTAVLAQCTPILESWPGWSEDISACKSYDELPGNCRKYLDRIAELTGIPISLISVGPERTQTITSAMEALTHG